MLIKRSIAINTLKKGLINHHKFSTGNVIVKNNQPINASVKWTKNAKRKNKRAGLNLSSIFSKDLIKKKDP